MFKLLKKSILLLILSNIFASKLELILAIGIFGLITGIPQENFEVDRVDKEYIYKDSKSKKIENSRKKNLSLEWYNDEFWMEYTENDCVELKKFCNKQPSSNFTSLNKNDDNCCYCYY